MMLVSRADIEIGELRGIGMLKGNKKKDPFELGNKRLSTSSTMERGLLPGS